jgi:beta-N-acetylhexosaminidase
VLSALAACAAAALALVVFEVLDRTPRAEGPASRQASDEGTGLVTRQLAGQRLVCGFYGTSLPASIRRQIAAGDLGGVILFERNIESIEQVRALTRELQSIERPPPLDAPLIATADQEGGRVSRLPGAPPESAAEIGELGPRFARRQGERVGSLMRRAGLNVDLAPVLDVRRPGGFIEEEGRSFGSTPGQVRSVGLAFSAGLRDAGVIPAAKHYPGLGASEYNTDRRASTISLSADELRNVDQAPFEAFSRSGPGLIMVSSGSYPALGEEEPASQMATVSTTELRERLGFEGVSITDALEAKGAQTAIPKKVALKVAQAGVDILLYGSCNTAIHAREALNRALLDGRLSRQSFEQSVSRILALRAKLSK